MQLISEVFIEAQRINRDRSSAEFPEPLKKVQRFFEGQQDPSGFIKMFTPKEATLSMSLDEEGNTVFTTAAKAES